MPPTKALVLYDFEGQAGTSELNIVGGETLTVTSKDVGEGWWEGTNQQGRSGIFPAAYVEEISSHEIAPPAMPPPPLPEAYVQENSAQSQVATTDYDDEWDDDWDDDVSEANHGANIGAGGGPSAARSNSDVSSLADMNLASKIGDGKGTVRKNLNRFSTFVKTGGEAYILGATKVSACESDKLTIVDHHGIEWSPVQDPYSCCVASPKKESKLKGLKSFIAYQLTPSLNNIQVSRRYKHFDWLHERLTEKFCIVPIPPLPDKQISGRYEEQFIERRRLQLQSFVQRVCDHPVLSRSDVWMHFLTCTDAKRWKTGKRKAEKDEVIGANIFSVINVPDKSLDSFQMESQTDAFGRFVQSFDAAVRLMQQNFAEHVKRHQQPYKRDYQRIAQSFKNLGNAMELDGLRETEPLTRALSHTGDTYEKIATICEDQPRLDLEPMGDVLHDYRGLLASFPDIITVHRGALQKRRELERSASEGKTESSVVSRAQQRTDVVSYALSAEMTYFHQRRVRDYNSATKIFLQEQIAYYQKITELLQSTLSQYQ